MAGAGGGGWVRAAGGVGSPVGPVGGGGGGRGAAVACLAAPGGAGAVVAGAGGGGRVRAEEGTGSPAGLVGGGRSGHGAAVAPGVRERRKRSAGGSRWRLRERERRKWVVEAWWRCGERERRGWVRRAGGERKRRRLRDRGSSVESGQSGGVGGSWRPRAAPFGTGGVGRGVVAAVDGGTGRVGPRGAPSAWTWWLGGHGCWYGGDGPSW